MINSFADKAFRDKAFNNAKDPKYDGFALVYLDLFQWFITFLIKKAKKLLVVVLKMKIFLIKN